MFKPMWLKLSQSHIYFENVFVKFIKELAWFDFQNNNFQKLPVYGMKIEDFHWINYSIWKNMERRR